MGGTSKGGFRSDLPRENMTANGELRTPESITLEQTYSKFTKKANQKKTTNNPHQCINK